MRRIQIIIQLLILLALWLILVEVIKPENLVAKIVLWIVSAILGGLAVYLTQEEFYDWIWGFTQFIKRLVGGKDVSVSLRKTENISVPISPEELRRLENIAPPRGAELIVISSGKGGVGKSLLALGIVEHLSKRGNVLLVDFDLQNRGLTSLLNKSESDPPSVFGLLDQFRNMLGKGTDQDTRKVFSDLLNTGLELPNDFNNKHFLTMTEKFARARENEIWDNLQEFEMLPINLSNYFRSPKEIPIADDLVPLYPPNAFFLPSRLVSQRLESEGVNEPFLFTGVSTSSFPIVYLFLRSLSWWLGAPIQGKEGVESIVLDCHGAHDMFTVGSILAAQKLIIVTTPDPGSWDGTGELLATVQKIQKEFTTRKDIIVVFNSMHNWDEVPRDIEKKFGIKGLQPKDIVTIAEDKRIRNLMKQYEFGQIAKHRRLWRSIRKICDNEGNKLNHEVKPKRKDDLDASQPITSPKEPDQPKGPNLGQGALDVQTTAGNSQVSDAKKR